LKRLVIALLLAIGVAWPGLAAAELREIEAVGFVALDPAMASRRSPRDAAMRSGVAAAVRRVALQELPGFRPEDEAALDEALGGDPMQFASRFRIVEDRGVQPALLGNDPSIETEYVVVVSVYVDVDRVKQRLTDEGLLSASPVGISTQPRVYLVLEGLRSHDEYQAVRSLLIDELRVRSASPVMMERGRAVLEVEADRTPRELLSALLGKAPDHLILTPLEIRGSRVSVRVRFTAPPARLDPGADRQGSSEHARPASRAGPAGRLPIDTPGQNRY